MAIRLFSPELFSAFAEPFITYFQATISEPCKGIGTKEFAAQQSNNRSKRKVKRRERKDTGSTFSLVSFMKKQREMTSPEFEGMVTTDSIRDHYLEDSYQHHDSSPLVH